MEIKVDTKKYFGLEKAPARVKETFAISVSDNAYLPEAEDTTKDWLSFIAIPAFKLIRDKAEQPITSFCSIGTGSGLDILAGAEIFGAERVALTDLQENVVKAAVRNVKSNLTNPDGTLIEYYIGDLFAPLRNRAGIGTLPPYDVIYENLPNVPLTQSKDVLDDRNSGHYLKSRDERIPEEIHGAMLDLHYLALQQSSDFLSESGVIISLIGGRVPLTTLFHLGDLSGVDSSILTYQWKVQAEPDDVISGYAQQEKEGYGPFIFYRAADLKRAFAGVELEETGAKALEIEASLKEKRLTANEALEAYRNGESIGHTVVVLESHARKKLNKITSFTVNHLVLEPGIYVSRKDKVGSETITTFDLRMTRPNKEPVMNTAEIHTIEHLGATFLRNDREYKDKVIYFGPMGCRTGFYLIMAGDLTSREVVAPIIKMFEFIRQFEGEIPGAKARDCGNYLDQNLDMAHFLADRYLNNTLYGIDEKHLIYQE